MKASKQYFYQIITIQAPLSSQPKRKGSAKTLEGNKHIRSQFSFKNSKN